MLHSWSALHRRTLAHLPSCARCRPLLQLKLDEARAVEEVEARMTAASEGAAASSAEAGPAAAAPSLSGRTVSNMQLEVLSSQALADEQQEGEACTTQTLLQLCSSERASLGGRACGGMRAGSQACRQKVPAACVHAQLHQHQTLSMHAVSDPVPACLPAPHYLHPNPPLLTPCSRTFVRTFCAVPRGVAQALPAQDLLGAATLGWVWAGGWVNFGGRSGGWRVRHCLRDLQHSMSPKKP